MATTTASMDSVAKLHNLYKDKSVDSLFLDPKSHINILCESLKNIFDAAVKESVRPFGPLEELITENLDTESIWEEVQTRNRPVIRYIKNQIRKQKEADEARLKLEAEAKADVEPASESEPESDENGSDNDMEGQSEEEEVEEESDSDNEEDDDKEDDDSDIDASDSDGDGGSDSDSDSTPLMDAEGRTSRRYDAMDDDMERFLDRADDLEDKYQRKLEALEKQNKGHRGVLELDDYDDSDAGDEEMRDETDDMFAITDAIYATDDDEEEEEDEDGGGIHAEDFFGPMPTKGKKGKDKGKGADKSKNKSTGSSSSSSSGSKQRRSVAFKEVPDEEDSDGDFNGADDDQEEGDWGSESEEEEEEEEEEKEKDVKKKSNSLQPMSRQAKQEASLHRQMDELEAGLLQPKSWDLAGEVGSAARPENSLLSIATEVDRSSKPAPIITQQYSATIEDMIKRRILEERWDDLVAPREKTEVSAGGGGADFDLSQEKSKEGLGELYANEFLKNTMQYSQSAGQLEEKREEVRSLFDKVCRNLDALSHFYFQPKPVTREVQLTSMATTNNVASMNIEDIMPVFESSAAAQAPEETQEKKHGREVTLMSREEMTSEDRKALRRAHKASNRKEKNMRAHEEKLVAKLNPGMGNKYERQKTLDMIRNDKRVTMMGDVGGKRKKNGDAIGAGGGAGAVEKATSSNLFRQLQDEAKRTIDEKRSKKPRV